MVNTMEVFANKKARNSGTAAAAIASSFLAGANTVFADGDPSAVADSQLKSVFGNIKALIGTIFKWIGWMLLAWGVAQLLLAFKNEDADSKSRAMMLIGVGAGLTVVNTFINMVATGG